MNEIEHQLSVISRNTVEIIETGELRKKIEQSLATNRPLRIKYGIDPTAPEIHLGHTVPIKKLRDFQSLGHSILFLIGDFTARIGDPTGRKETRPNLTVDEINANLSRYRDQAGKILDLDKTEFVYNSHWLATMNLDEILKVASIFTIAQILEREDFTLRYKAQKPISFHEFLYPLLQGYDSFVLKADVEIGATEQKFNLLAGRTIQEALGQEKQVVITMPILVGTDGKMKMSKSYGNHIPVETTPKEMFGKLMSIPDSLMADYATFLTDIRADAFKTMIENHPRAAKSYLAAEVVNQYFGKPASDKELQEFDNVYRDGKDPENIPDFTVPAELREDDGSVSLLKLLTAAQAVPSNAEGRRMVTQKAVDVDGACITDPFARLTLKDGQVVRVGKRRFFRIKLPT